MSLPGLPSLACRHGAPGPVEANAQHPAWRAVEPVALLENLAGVVPAQATRVRTLQDAGRWRILFEADAHAPWATLTARDAQLWTEEVVEVFIDPVGDGMGYFEVEINPLGAVVDLVLRRTASGWRKDFAWNVAGLASHARRTPEGWVAELSIPFNALGPEDVPPPGARWRVNFLRIDRPDGPGSERRELSAWSPTGMANFHRHERFGAVEFADDPSAS